MNYHGSCHCGTVAYTVEADISESMTCNCSHCAQKGFILTFVPAAAFTLEKGADQLIEYRFNTKKIQHLFCKICGVESFARGIDASGNESIMINARCLAGVDTASLTPGMFNGKDF
jgi:hypothetical protein